MHTGRKPDTASAAVCVVRCYTKVVVQDHGKGVKKEKVEVDKERLSIDEVSTVRVLHALDSPVPHILGVSSYTDRGALPNAAAKIYHTYKPPQYPAANTEKNIPTYRPVQLTIYW